ncbi:hypothetical protein G0T78_004662 [Escherichia coli]|nr:hypothetical protein [Escherichia coli]EFI9106985.1 hypothetical protein [Escherichia coli]
MRIIILVALMLGGSPLVIQAATTQGSTKFSVSIVRPTCDINFDPLLSLNPVPHANGIIEHPEITISVSCNSETLNPWIRLTHNEPIVDLYKIRMQPNQLLLSFKEKNSQKYVMYNSTDSTVTDPSMTGMLGGQSHNYDVQLIPVSEVDDHQIVMAQDGSALVGVELFYK